MTSMGFWVEWMTCLHSYSQAESHELPQAKIGRDLTLLEIDLILASQREKIFKNRPSYIFIHFLAWDDCLRSLECKYSIRIHINGLLTNLEKLWKSSSPSKKKVPSQKKVFPYWYKILPMTSAFISQSFILDFFPFGLTSKAAPAPLPPSKMSSHIEIYNPSLVFLLHFTKSHSGLFPFGTGDY